MKHQNIPWWKESLSYLNEIRLEKTNSAITDNLKLGIKNGRIYLSTNNSIYSYEDLYTSFRTGLEHLEKEIPEFNSVLILGFGMGSIAWMLRNMFDSTAPITGIELDPWVAEQFAKYYDYENIQIVIKDASKFLEEQSDTYDFICVDLYEDELIPSQFQTREFFEAVKETLNPGGYVLYNKLPSEGENFGPHSSLAKAFTAVFPDNRMIPARSNRMIIGIK